MPIFGPFFHYFALNYLRTVLNWMKLNFDIFNVYKFIRSLLNSKDSLRDRHAYYTIISRTITVAIMGFECLRFDPCLLMLQVLFCLVKGVIAQLLSIYNGFPLKGK